MRDLNDDELAAHTAAKRQLDFDDLQREVSGQEAGRMRRFLSSGDPRAMSNEKKKAKEQAYRDLLDQLLQDPEYKALYIELSDKLGTAERDADTAIEMIQRQLQLAEQAILNMETAAAKGPDGNPVFRYADGRVVNADGEDLPPEIAEGIQWPDNAPSAEDYFTAKRQRDDLAVHLDNLHTYRNEVLGDIRHRYDDRENPMSKDDMRDALQTIEANADIATGFAIQEAPDEKPAKPITSPAFIPAALN